MSLKSSSGFAGRCSTVSRARSPRRTPRKRSRVSARRTRSWRRRGPSRGSSLRCPGGSSGLPRPTGGRSRTRWVPVSTKHAAEDVLIDVSRAEPLRGGKTLRNKIDGSGPGGPGGRPRGPPGRPGGPAWRPSRRPAWRPSRASRTPWRTSSRPWRTSSRPRRTSPRPWRASRAWGGARSSGCGNGRRCPSSRTMCACTAPQEPARW